MGKNSKKLCKYESCLVDLMINKTNFGIKAFVFFIGFISIIVNPYFFSFINIGLLILPVFLDDYIKFTKSVGVYIIPKILFAVKVVNIIVVAFCLCGVVGYIIDTGETFMVSDTALLFNGFCIDKSIIALILLVDLIQTIILYIFVPRSFESDLVRLVKKMN